MDEYEIDEVFPEDDYEIEPVVATSPRPTAPRPKPVSAKPEPFLDVRPRDADPYEIEPVAPVVKGPARIKGGTQETRERMGLWDRATGTVEEALQHDILGVGARKLNDWFNTGKADMAKKLRAKNPNISDDEIEVLHDRVINLAQRGMREEMAAKFAEDPAWRPDESFFENFLSGRWAASTGATLAAGLGDPTTYLNPYAKAAGLTGVAKRAGAQVGIGGAANVGAQVADISDGVSDEFDPMQLLLAASAAGGLQGLFDVAGAGLRKYKTGEWFPEPAQALAPAPEAVAPRLVGDELQAASNEIHATGTADEILAWQEANGLRNEDPDGLRAWVEARDAGEPVSPEGIIRGTGETPALEDAAYEQALSTGTANDILLSLEGTGRTMPRSEAEAYVQARDTAARGQQVADAQDPMLNDNPAPDGSQPELDLGKAVQTPNPRFSNVDEVNARVQKLTGSWKNAPEFNTVNNIDELPDDIRQSIIDDGAENDVVGFLAPDGKVHLIADRIGDEATLSSVVFHEALGHKGLSERFNTRLDGMMELLYKQSPVVKQKADAYLENNPGAYADGNQTARIVEEALAEMSEGGRIEASVYRKLEHFVKQFIRDMGLDIEVSEKEVMAILAMAHSRIIDGGNKASSSIDGLRYIRTWHGTPHKFDKFDHSKMGSGEGAQAYGWGTYLAESRNVAESYKKKLSQTKITWNGVDVPLHATRDNMLRDARNKGVNGPLVAEVLDYARDYKRVPSLAEFKKYQEFYNDVEGVTKFSDEKLKEVVDFASSRLKVSNPGELLEVDIPDDAKFLDLDAPLSEQPDVIRAMEDSGFNILSEEDFQKLYEPLNAAYAETGALAKRLESMDPADPAYAAVAREYDAAVQQERSAEQALDESLRNNIREDETGMKLYSTLSGELGGDKKASEFLKLSGITGNRYLDGMSRDSKGGTSNYVIFDDNVPKITNRYMRRKPNKIGNINLDRLSSTRDIDNVLEEGAARVSRGSVQTHDATKAFAKMQGMTVKELLDLEPNFDEVKAYQAREILVTSMNKVDRLSEQIASGNNSDIKRQEFLQAFLQFQTIYEKVAGLTSHAGRLLNAFNIIASGRRGGGVHLNYMLEKMDNASLMSPEAIDEAARQFQRLKNDPRAAARLRKRLANPSTRDYLTTGWYAALLSDPATHGVNTIGQVSAIGLEFIDAAMASLLGQRNRFNGKERVPAREVLGMLQGLGSAMKLFNLYTQDGKTRARVTDTWRNTYKAFKEGTSLSGPGRTQTRGAIFPWWTGIEVPLRGLAATDEFFFNVIHSMKQAGYMTRKAVNEGLTGDELKARLQEPPSDEVIDAAAKDALRMQFRDEMSPLGNWASRITTYKDADGAWASAGKGLMKVLIPFLSTMDGIIRYQLRYNPLTASLDRYNKAGAEAGGAEADLEAARVLLGTAFGTYVFIEAMKGNVTADGPAEYQKREALMSRQWRPNSIKLPGGYTSIQGLDPISGFVKSVAGVAEQIKYSKKGADEPETPYEDQMVEAVRRLGGALGQASSVGGLFAFITAMNDKSGQGEEDWKNWVANTSSSILPNLVRGVNRREFDDAKRNTTGDTSLVDRIVGRFESGIPTLSDNLPQQYDVWGRPQTYDPVLGPDYLSRLGQAAPEKDEVVIEIGRIENDMGKTLVGPVTRNNLSDIIEKREGAKRKATAEEIEEYQRLSGEYIKAGLQELIAAPEWDNMVTEEKAAAVKKLVSQYRKLAREQLYPEGGDEYEVEEFEPEYEFG